MKGNTDFHPPFLERNTDFWAFLDIFRREIGPEVDWVTKFIGIHREVVRDIITTSRIDQSRF